MSVEPFKYLVQPVALERDASGRAVRELPAQTLTVYNAATAAEAIEHFERELAALPTRDQNGEAMPVSEKTVTTISCDNATCPGGSGLDPKDRAGWLFVSAEIYGEPTTAHVFCCADCLSAAAGTQAVPLGFTKSPEEVTQ